MFYWFVGISFLLWIAGAFFFLRKKKVLALVFALAGVLAFVAFVLSWFSPEITSSPWMLPHILCYMSAYALLTLALALGWKSGTAAADRFVLVGTLCLSCGLVLGGLWAVSAWGAFWSWDPKENWAAITVAAYTLYLILRKCLPERRKLAFVILILAFLCLNMCWWGINLIPSARMRSVHLFVSA